MKPNRKPQNTDQYWQRIAEERALSLAVAERDYNNLHLLYSRLAAKMAELTRENADLREALKLLKEHL